MVRCIVYSNENGSREGVFFTEDMDTQPDDFIPPGCSLDEDFTLNDKFPSAFPFEYNLERS